MRARDGRERRTRCRATARARPSRTTRGSPRRRRRSARDASIASIACDLAASTSPRWASRSANGSEPAPLYPGPGRRSCRRWSSDAAQSPARNSTHPSSACRTAARIVVARTDRFVEERRAHRAALVDLARPRREAARRGGSGVERRSAARSTPRARAPRSSSASVDALSEPHPRGDERRERVGQRIGIVHRSGEPQRLFGVAQRARQVSRATRARSSATQWIELRTSAEDRVLSSGLRQDIDGPALVVADHEGTLQVGGAPRPDRARAERRTRLTRGARTPSRSRRKAGGTRRRRRADGARRRPGRVA